MKGDTVVSDHILAEKLGAFIKLEAERWRAHKHAHESLAQSLAEYKSAANEWRSTLNDIRLAGVTRPEYIAEHKALEARVTALMDRMEANDQAGEAKGEAVHRALEQRINTTDNALSTAATERQATYRLFGQARNLILVIFTVMAGIIGLLVYLRA
jgi:hypothetical protein